MISNQSGVNYIDNTVLVDVIARVRLTYGCPVLLADACYVQNIYNTVFIDVPTRVAVAYADSVLLFDFVNPIAYNHFYSMVPTAGIIGFPDTFLTYTVFYSVDPD